MNSKRRSAATRRPAHIKRAIEKRSLVLWVGITGALLALLFPPYHWRGANGKATGFHFVFRPGEYVGDVDDERLLMELAFVGSVTYVGTARTKVATPDA